MGTRKRSAARLDARWRQVQRWHRVQQWRRRKPTPDLDPNDPWWGGVAPGDDQDELVPNAEQQAAIDAIQAEYGPNYWQGKYVSPEQRARWCELHPNG